MANLNTPNKNILMNSYHYNLFKTAVTEYHYQHEDVSQWPKETSDDLLNFVLDDPQMKTTFIKYPPHMGNEHFRNQYGNSFFRWNARRKYNRTERLREIYQDDPFHYMHEKYNMDLATKDDSSDESSSDDLDGGFVNVDQSEYVEDLDGGFVHVGNARKLQTFKGTATMPKVPSDDDLLKKKHSWHNSVEDQTPKNLLKAVLTRNSPTRPTLLGPNPGIGPRCSNTDDLYDGLPPKLTRCRAMSPPNGMPELQLSPLVPESFISGEVSTLHLQFGNH